MTNTLSFIPRAFLILALAGGWLASPAPATEPASRPNFLFVYTDDQRWDAMGVVQREQGERARFPWLTTPNMDRLAQGGTRFRNAFVTLSLCAPSRAAFLTGGYNHLNGVANNHTPFPTDNVTYASLLHAAGYTTGYVGKWHMDKQTERPGFDYSASFVAQGRYFDCPMLVNGHETPSTGWVDDVSTDYALDFLKKNRSRPFALVVGFKSTHGPFDPPERAKDRFAGDEARPVPNLDVPAIYQGGVKLAPKQAAKQAVKNSALTKRGTNLGYFRCISAADDNLGRLLDGLDQLDLAKNTVVIFTSDNGYYLGEHGLGDKRTAYDESMRIPMLIRWPGHLPEGQTQDAMVLNVDIAPTLLDLAGLTPPPTMQGRSWRPLLAGQSSDWRHAFFYEYFREGRFGAPTVFAVRTDVAKLVKYPGHPEWTEMFDLAMDPYETKNLFDDPSAAALRAKLEAEYARQQQAVGFVTPAYADELAKPEVLAKPLDAWVLEYRFDKDEGDKVVDASGRGNDGRAIDAPLDAIGDIKGRRFSGHSAIDVRKSPSLNPAVQNWTLEVTFVADSPDGILVAQGGQSFGYCLALQGGRPVLVVNGSGQSTRIAAKAKVGTAHTGRTGRTTVRAGISSEQAWLMVDGQRVAEAPLRAALSEQPNDGLQIGDDLRSHVISTDRPPGFTGLIESVRLYSGMAPATVE
ncbi:MAG TPA: sulfatase-like hydrolase/transferase [Pirellulales bacterium]|jgi:arylsulfatase A-like enzyme|nr:sulfatase-like hydrolase/transferase [Pirellulales bacterium]